MHEVHEPIPACVPAVAVAENKGQRAAACGHQPPLADSAQRAFFSLVDGGSDPVLYNERWQDGRFLGGRHRAFKFVFSAVQREADPDENRTVRDIENWR
jgi:hypothetical protein